MVVLHWAQSVHFVLDAVVHAEEMKVVPGQVEHVEQTVSTVAVHTALRYFPAAQVEQPLQAVSVVALQALTT